MCTFGASGCFSHLEQGYLHITKLEHQNQANASLSLASSSMKYFSTPEDLPLSFPP